jgi:hypothetical protein
MGVSVDPRFTDNLDGTVTDHLTGLVWLRKANCFGKREWANALSSANNLADGSCGLSDGSIAGDWRLPNVRELHSLVGFDITSPGIAAGHPFLGVPQQVYVGYWTSTTIASDPADAFWVDVSTGRVAAFLKTGVVSSFWVWAVRGPDANAPSAPSPVPKTGQTACWDESGASIACTGTGQDGEFQMGVSVDPRFTDNLDGSVTDNLTGLVWLRNANCFGPRWWPDALSDANTLADGSCGLSDSSIAGDWRLPNVRELHSLIDYGRILPALPAGHPFLGVVNYNYWTSTTSYPFLESARFVGMHSGRVEAFFKTNISEGFSVWPVRGPCSDDGSDVPATTRIGAALIMVVLLGGSAYVLRRRATT